MSNLFLLRRCVSSNFVKQNLTKTENESYATNKNRLWKQSKGNKLNNYGFVEEGCSSLTAKIQRENRRYRRNVCSKYKCKRQVWKETWKIPKQNSTMRMVFVFFGFVVFEVRELHPSNSPFVLRTCQYVSVDLSPSFWFLVWGGPGMFFFWKDQKKNCLV